MHTKIITNNDSRHVIIIMPFCEKSYYTLPEMQICDSWGVEWSMIKLYKQQEWLDVVEFFVLFNFHYEYCFVVSRKEMDSLFFF